MLTSNDKGNIAEAAIALEAIKLGIDVLKPVAEHGRYDLAFDLGHRILRVPCTWGPSIATWEWCASELAVPAIHRVGTL